MATFLTSEGVPHSLHANAALPLSLVIKPCPPVKDADFKVTLSTNKPAVSLLELFPEFVLDSSMTNAAGFQVYGGPVITVLSSKTSQRYRLQSESLPAIWVIGEHVLKRLQQKFPADLECGYTSSLPLQEFFLEIDAHFSKRRQRRQVMETLAQRTAQFRSIQRRLLTRFKDKTPVALTNLDMLLEGTHRQVLQSAEALEIHGAQLEAGAADLACIVRWVQTQGQEPGYAGCNETGFIWVKFGHFYNITLLGTFLRFLLLVCVCIIRRLSGCC